MDIKVDIKPEDVNKAVAEAILNSSIGEQLRKAINEEVAKIGRSYENPFAPIIRQLIAAEVRNLIDTQYREQIRAVVTEKVTEEFTNELLGRMWDVYVREGK
jgi:citrate lyase gamma subunit